VLSTTATTSCEAVLKLKSNYKTEMTFQTLLAPSFLILTATAWAADFTHATVVLPAQARPVERKAAVMLVEEVEKRSQVRWQIGNTAPAFGAIILLTRGSGPAEGFTLRSSGQQVTVLGNDDRGIVFGAGSLLRKLEFRRGHTELEANLDLSTAPKTQVRGHQLGYRPKTNSYDAWSVAMWEQYIRDLAIFGTNTIELIPPRSDDDADSPHFSLPPLQMMTEMSRITGEYGLDVSIWYPAMDKDYSDAKTVVLALHEWEEVFRALPRIDNIFVPGGDPGHTQPKYLLGLLEKETEVLHRYHPKATMWVSPQSFNQEWMDEFYGLLQKEPKWLAGLVFGPQVRDSFQTVRERTPKRYPIRFYPDITHSVHSQFPVPDWDVAFALTANREGINPRPTDEAAIFRVNRPYSNGFVSYSEGCNDDVNKFVWSGLGWDPDAKPIDLLRDFSHYFIGAKHSEAFAQGLLALEQNWKGPLLTNSGVLTTLEQFQSMERTATPQEKLNWRWQQAMYRANYDAYIRSRLLAETAAEERTMAALRQARAANALTPQVLPALDQAEGELDRAYLHRAEAAADLRARVFELAEALFQSIHMQLSVDRYQAIGYDRGANLDTLDLSLNNRVWLKAQFTAIRSMATERERVAAVDDILNWTNPGPGGFYDDLGNLTQQPHLVRGPGFEKDPDYRHSSLVGFGNRAPDQGWRLSWLTHAETLGDTPLELRYHDLDRTARYKVRVVYAGDTPRVPIRLTANEQYEIHPFLPNQPEPKRLEFVIPPVATKGGELRLRWNRPTGLGGNGRGVQVSEVWLIRDEK